MPSYLVTIRLSADLPSVATALAEEIAAGNCEAVRTGLVRTKLESVEEGTPPADASLVAAQMSRTAATIAHRYRTDSAAIFAMLSDGWTFTPPGEAPQPESVAAVRALSPAVVEELRQMWRADFVATRCGGSPEHYTGECDCP